MICLISMYMVSIIIPVKNGGATLKKCLIAVKQQTIAHASEIIVLDSMSTDNSREIAENFGARIIFISAGTFNHGLTRNIGVQEAMGELVYFTVQDAYLAEDDQLERMAAHFEDEEIQSVTGIQGIPADVDKNPAAWFKRFSLPIPEVRHFNKGEFEQFSNTKQLELSNWDNVNTMYRRTALLSLPFCKADFGEDALWAKSALGRGWKLIRDASLLVYHYHHNSFVYSFRIAYVLNYTLWKEFNVLPKYPSFFLPFTKKIYTVVRRKELSVASKVKWVFHNLFSLGGYYLSAITFKVAYLIGKDHFLDSLYKRLCLRIPQGFQNKSLSKVPGNS